MTLRDLRNYESVWREPVIKEFNGHRFYMMPPPSSGGIVTSQVLTMIGSLNPDSVGCEFIPVYPPDERGPAALVRRSELLFGGSGPHGNANRHATVRIV